MGRRRTKNRDLPPGVTSKVRGGERRFYYGRNQIALGSDFAQMLVRYAKLRGTGSPAAKTFADAISAYLDSEEFRAKKPNTQREYSRQAVLLTKVFGATALDHITPKHVRDYMKVRPAKIAATREKALLSLVFEFARGEGMTNAPNPVAGIKGKKAIRGRYVRDDELKPVLEKSEQVLRDFLLLCYYTGQDAGRVVRWTVQDVRHGHLWNERDKTGEKVQIETVGPLADVLARLTASAHPKASLLRDERGHGIKLQAMRRRFWRARAAAGQDWQIRDLRAKAASDVETTEDARALLAHSDITTTGIYRRRASGTKAKPVMRKVSE
jgi:integrase